jgi:hypothetical protein
MSAYATVDAVEFVAPAGVKPGSLVDRIRKNEL